MKRAEALAFLQGQFSSITTGTGIPESDTTTGYGPVIDNALRAMGVGESDLAAYDVTTSVLNYMALLEYYALKKFVKALVMKYNYSIDGQAHSEQQLFANVNTLFQQAQATVAAMGYQVEGQDQFAWGVVSTDYLEP